MKRPPDSPVESPGAERRPPPLDSRRLKRHRVPGPEGLLEAFRPATPDYTCRDAHAPALVCIPGLAMDGTCFIRQLPLATGADLHLLRLPGYPTRGEDGTGHFSCYVERYVHRMGLERRGVVLLGSSMGGAVAMDVAGRRNVALRGLVLVGTFGHHRHLSRRQRLMTRLSWALPGFLIRLLAGPMVRRTGGFGLYSRAEADFMLSCLRIPSHGYLVRGATALRRLDLLAGLRGLSVPTLVLHGTDDRVLPFEAGRELAQTIPNARLVAIEDGSHATFFLDHGRVNSAVVDFLREVASDV